MVVWNVLISSGPFS